MTGITLLNALSAVRGPIPNTQDELNFLRTIMYRRQIWIGIFVWLLAIVVTIVLGIKQYKLWKKQNQLSLYQIKLTNLSLAQSQKSFRMTRYLTCINRYLDQTASEEMKSIAKKEADEAEDEIIVLDELIRSKAEEIATVYEKL